MKNEVKIPAGKRYMLAHERPNWKRGDLVFVQGKNCGITGHNGDCTVKTLKAKYGSSHFWVTDIRCVTPRKPVKTLGQVLRDAENKWQDNSSGANNGIRKWEDYLASAVAREVRRRDRMK